MAQLSHILMVASGGYTDEAVEHWQIGVRFILTNSSGTPDNTGTLPLVDVGATDVGRTEADWTIASNWDATSGIDTFNPDDWLNDQVAPSFVSHFGSLHCSDKVRVDSLKASPIGTDGHVVEGRTCLLDWTSSNPAGTTGGNPLPIQNSVAVSWKTPRIGARGKGRIYLPYMSTAGVDAGGECTGSVQSGILDNAILLIQDAAIAGGGSSDWWVLPIVTGSPWTEYGIITSVNVGSVVDTQRRRRRSLPEVRVSGATSYA